MSDLHSVGAVQRNKVGKRPFQTLKRHRHNNNNNNNHTNEYLMIGIIKLKMQVLTEFHMESFSCGLEVTIHYRKITDLKFFLCSHRFEDLCKAESLTII